MHIIWTQCLFNRSDSSVMRYLCRESTLVLNTFRQISAHFCEQAAARDCLWRRSPGMTAALSLGVCFSRRRRTVTPYTWAEKFESFERINSIRETNGNFDSCNSCKRLVPSRLHELHESKFPFVSRIEFIRSKLSNVSAHVYGACVFFPSSADSSCFLRLLPPIRRVTGAPPNGLVMDHLTGGN